MTKPRFSEPRPPAPGETCAVSVPELWKRDALLFDKVYVAYLLHGDNHDIPMSLTYNLPAFEARVADGFHAASMASVYGSFDPEGYAGMVNDQFFGTSDAQRLPYAQRRAIAQASCDEGIDATPIFEYERTVYRAFPEGAHPALEVAIDDVPLVEGGLISWEAVLEFRSDADAVRKFRGLRSWLQRAAASGSAGEAVETIGTLVDEYTAAIRKHGLKASPGSFAQVFDGKQSPPVPAALATRGPDVPAGIRIMERHLELQGVKRGNNREVAILYEA